MENKEDLEEVIDLLAESLCKHLLDFRRGKETDRIRYRLRVLQRDYTSRFGNIYVPGIYRKI